jgi:hypothetical protein
MIATGVGGRCPHYRLAAWDEEVNDGQEKADGTRGICHLV